ncbi:hypothetical protein D3C73_1286160 [compost metagenome]
MTAHRVERLDLLEQRHRLVNTPQLHVERAQPLQGGKQRRVSIQHLAVAGFSLGILLFLRFYSGQGHLRLGQPMGDLRRADVLARLQRLGFFDSLLSHFTGQRGITLGGNAGQLQAQGQCGRLPLAGKP